ncbi:MAG TPA: hypothetical protein PKO15_06535 [Fibrobacteria bacterium]|nr:hypothetical protein [Fibrobacteria bacterium]
MHPKSLVAVSCLVAAVLSHAGPEPLTYSHPVLRAPSAIPAGPFMDSAIRKLSVYTQETRRLEDSAAKSCLAKASSSGFSDPVEFEACQKAAQALVAKREQSTSYFRARVEQETFRNRIAGWTFAPVLDLKQADEYYGFDSSKLRAASEVDFSFSEMARPSVGVVAWEDYLLLFRYSLSLHLPSGEEATASDRNRSALDRIATTGGSVSPKVAFPFLTYVAPDKHLALELQAAVPVEVPGMGTVQQDIAAHVQAGVGGSALLVGRRDVLGVLLVGDLKYVYGLTKNWRDQLRFYNDDGFGLARGGVGLQVYNHISVVATFQAGIGEDVTDVVAADYPVGVSISITR